MTGPQLYDAYCAACHEVKGQGSADGALPSLFHNTALGRTNTNNLVMVILEGVHRPPDASPMLMPGFTGALSDQQVATLGGYLLERYGNPRARITADQVRELRGGGASSRLTTAVRVGMIAAACLVALVVAFFVLRRRRAASS